jgi:CrcB protein
MEQGELEAVALVAGGGALGSTLRYFLSGWVTRGSFPWGTFTVNFVGTFFAAFLFFGMLTGGFLTPTTRTLLFVGVFGGFTTFSTFGVETAALVGEGQLALAAANVALNAGLCIAGALAGRALGIWAWA